MTEIFERHPSLLLVKDIPSAVQVAVDHIYRLKPVFDLSEIRVIVRKHPHLIYRVLYFEEFDILPFDIKVRAC